MNTLLFKDTLITPSKVICIGRNYVEHIYELNNEIPSSMVVFNKPNSAITDTLHFITPDTRFEGEICFLMMEGAIAGVGFGLDLTKGDLQNYLKSKALPWERAKGFDGSAVLGDFVPLTVPLESLRMTLHINGVLVQEATYELMIYKPSEMVKEIARFMSFEDGDIIMSGTPKGVSTYHIGDTFIGRIYSGNTVVVESQWSVL
ncbi:MAG: 2-keto-4-pentenoate hydratase [Sulfuricurvum sp. GWF2_44_89]|uniref:2-keto-4-pentenoate hydratase n=1 Tax=Sulfuricurvum kujiense TaxID=148813 RepID=A0A2D3WGF9_9BACT|nr:MULTISPECIES: fumarylacetoacetate hydrolase family protein [Sulfuricurvum]OHD79489.1 MAG: 2-keto-4-pentenoate hydratase [Sulfuricurvum sp. GWF2_44_89]OHD92265.1 MAG: 2-keto-4-pentenoate hydratase [Sulfuricurvum sp. RIFOXYD12_FULL_44_77]OHD94470.1 MAG: 2-keto-4-pentenoate hydratase [Sulfuricurvum sp. RIFOXYD2_FULL_44_160]DAB39498.1 MAG TPA: 2-keto-4-pentenoate hydratase [Sulfuricurvum kujiense]